MFRKQKTCYDQESVCKTQIFLDTIGNVYNTLDGHLNYFKNKNKLIKVIGSKQYNDELLKRIDSLMNVLTMFGISCKFEKKSGNLNRLKLGKIEVLQVYNKLTPKQKTMYKPYVTLLLYCLNGNNLYLPKRIKNTNDFKPKVNSKNVNEIFSQLIGGQCKVDSKIKEYKKNDNSIETLYKNHKQTLKDYNTLPNIKQPPKVQDLYNAWDIKHQRFDDEYNSNKNKPDLFDYDDEKNGNKFPVNALIFPDKTEYKIPLKKHKYKYITINKSQPMVCQMMEDINNSMDNKILVQLASPYESIEFRPFIKDILYCKSNELKNFIMKMELGHIKKIGQLSPNYKPIASKNDVIKAEDQYKESFADTIDNEYNSNNDNKNHCCNYDDNDNDHNMADQNDFNYAC